MEGAKEANGHSRPMEDVSSEQYSALPTTGADRMQLIPGQERTSGSSMESGTEVSPLQMELGKQNNSCQVEGLKVIVISAISFSVAITVALIITIYFGPPQVPLHGAVACDAPECAAVGTEILRAGGSSVDAAIASTFCLSVVHPYAAGIGGGGYVAVRNNWKDESVTIDARETAPGQADRSLYEEGSRPLPAAMTIATPGLLRGLEMAHQQYGKLSWSALIQPSIKLANETGFNVTKEFIESLSQYSERDLQQFVTLHQWLMQKSRMPMEGDTLFNRDLADTLSRIAEGGADAFYNDISKDMAKQIEDLNGILTVDDFRDYKANKGKPMETSYSGMTVQSVAPPAGGAIVLMMLNLMDALRAKTDNGSAGLAMHWFIEAQKFSSVESGHLGDPSFSPEVYNITSRMISKEFAHELANFSSPEHTFGPQWYSDRTKDAIAKLNAPGTCTVTVIGADEQMVAISMSLGHPWGSKIMTDHSGVILNDQMLSFSQPTDTPTDPLNHVEPYKRPASFLCPSLVFSRKKPCAQRMALGAGGGDRSPAALTEVIRDVIGLGQGLAPSIAAPRVYAALLENRVYYEDRANNTLAPEVLQYLADVGDVLIPTTNIGSVVNAAAKINETVTARADRRNNGGESIF